MFRELIDKLRRHADLTVDEAAAAMEAIMDGRAQPSQIAGLLVAILRVAQFDDPMILDQAEAVRVRLNELSSW